MQAQENPNRVRSMNLNEGSPVEISYVDGRVAQLLRKETVEEFRTDLVLAENTCRPLIGLKCRFVLPYIRQSYVGVWSKHSSRQGLPLEYADVPDHTFGKQVFITRSQNELFDRALARATVTPGVIANAYMGRLECETPLQPALPESKRIVFWDESYEQGNSELAIANGPGTRITQIWRRYEGIDLNFQTSNSQHTVNFKRYKKAYGVYTDYHPMGIAYRYLMTFRGPSIYDASDDSCTLKWDVDFTQYFTQLSTVMQDGGTGRPDLGQYRKFNYSYENPNPYARLPFEKSSWESERMR